MIAITRPVSPTIDRCELTHLARAPIDAARAVAQHAEYERVLERLGYRIRRLPAAPDLPDAVFVEDTALVLEEVAVITRPGAPSRRPETTTMAEALRCYRPLACIEAPAALDGGDVLRVGRTLYVGRSVRTNAEAIGQLRGILAQFGYDVVGVPFDGCLHLKTAVTEVADGVLLLNPDWVDPQLLGGLELITRDPAEPFAANALRIGDRVVYPTAFPRTRERLERRGIGVEGVDVSELAKAEGGVTCCSVLVEIDE